MKSDVVVSKNYIDPKTNLYENLGKFKKSRFYGRLTDAILGNGHEAVGIWGAKGLGKSTLSRMIAKQIYGSFDISRQFRVTRFDELPALIDMVQHDSRYWIDYNGMTLKRIWILDFDDIAVAMPSSQTGATEEYIKFHKYFQTIRSHCAIILGSFPDWSDFKRRLKVGFTGEIALTWKTRKVQGQIHRYRRGQMLWFKNNPDYRKPYQSFVGKEFAIPVRWTNIPQAEMIREQTERQQLADRLLLDVRDASRKKARILAGYSGTADQHLLNYQKELLSVIWESCKHRPLHMTNTRQINTKYNEKFGVRISSKNMLRHINSLDSKELIIYRKEPNSHGYIQMADLGKETIRLLRENKDTQDDLITD